MDSAKFDTLARRASTLFSRQSRRGAVRAGAGLLLGGAVAVMAGEDAAARRNACHLRCGGDHRLCRGECHDNGVNEKQCKRTCTAWRDECFAHCEFKPLRRRTVNDEYDRLRRRSSG